MHTYLRKTYPRAHTEIYALALWGRVTHISFGNKICNQHITSVGSDNGLSPSPRQTIIWNNAVLLSIGPIGTRFGQTMFEIHFHSRIYIWKCRLGNYGSFCLSLKVSKGAYIYIIMISSRLIISTKISWMTFIRGHVDCQWYAISAQYSVKIHVRSVAEIGSRRGYFFGIDAISISFETAPAQMLCMYM